MLSDLLAVQYRNKCTCVTLLGFARLQATACPERTEGKGLYQIGKRLFASATLCLRVT
jgi:hypothetical protein